MKESLYCFVGGINGTGKTTVLAEVKKLNSNLEVIKGSAAFMQWLGLPPGDYDSLRGLSANHKDQEFAKLILATADRVKEQKATTLVDAHYINIIEGSIADCTGDWMGKFDALFVITANYQAVFDRICQDEELSKRNRSLFPKGADTNFKKKLITQYLEATDILARKLSKKHRVPYFRLENNQQAIDTAQEFSQIIHDLKRRW